MDSHQAAGEKTNTNSSSSTGRSRQHRGGEGPAKRVQAEGVTRRSTSAARRRHGGSLRNETSQIMSYFSGMFGPPPYADLTIVETEAGAPNGYAAPGLIFLSRAPDAPGGFQAGGQRGSRQWWEEMVSAATRNHLWLTNGWRRTRNCCGGAHRRQRRHGGPGSRRDGGIAHRGYVPIMQSARLEDYSPELWALTGSKGAASSTCCAT